MGQRERMSTMKPRPPCPANSAGLRDNSDSPLPVPMPFGASQGGRSARGPSDIRRHNAQEAHRLVANGGQLVPLIAADEYHVTGTQFGRLVAVAHQRAAV